MWSAGQAWWRLVVLPRAVRIAAALWIVWAFVVWNVVFDRVLVLAGRRYVHEASRAATSGHYLLINDAMRQAVATGVWMATAAAATILCVGLGFIAFAARGSHREKRGPSADSRLEPELGVAVASDGDAR